MNIIPDRSWPGSPTPAYGTIYQQGAGGQYVTVGRRRRSRRRRGGVQIRMKQERKKSRRIEIGVGSLNVGT